MKTSTRSVIDTLPRWTIPSEEPADPGSRDPLGFQRYAAVFADDLLPNLTVLTRRARYYSYISWALEAIEKTFEPRVVAGYSLRFDDYSEILARFERILALSEAIWHSKNGGDCFWIGLRRSNRIVNQGRGLLPLDTSFTVQEGSKGALGDYRQSMQNLGLLSRDQGVFPDLLTQKGEELAQAFRDSLPQGQSAKLIRLATDMQMFNVPNKDLIRFGARVCLSKVGRDEKRILRPLLLGGPHEPITKALAPFLRKRSADIEADLLLKYFSSPAQKGVGFRLKQAAFHQLFAYACLVIFDVLLQGFKGRETSLQVQTLLQRRFKLEKINTIVQLQSAAGKIDWKREFQGLNSPEEKSGRNRLGPALRLLFALAGRAREEAPLILQQPVESVSLPTVMEILLQDNQSTGDTIERLCDYLLTVHAEVFRSKHKRPWLFYDRPWVSRDESAVLSEVHFPPNSIRLGSLASIYRDLEVRHG